MGVNPEQVQRVREAPAVAPEPECCWEQHAAAARIMAVASWQWVGGMGFLRRLSVSTSELAAVAQAHELTLDSELLLNCRVIESEMIRLDGQHE